MRRAAHILLHQPHPGCGLDVESPAVEADPLADERDARMILLAPLDFDQPRRMMLRRRAPARVDHRIALFARLDRKSVWAGKSVSVRVNLGGRSLSKKKRIKT